MLLLYYIRWAKDPSRPPAEIDVLNFFWMRHWLHQFLAYNNL